MESALGRREVGLESPDVLFNMPVDAETASRETAGDERMPF